jgi:hypothetical protein
LTAEYLAVSLDFFRRSRSDCVALFGQCEALGWRKVALYGAGDLAEIAILSASETAVEVSCVIDSHLAGRRCGGLPVVPDLAAALTCGNAGGLDGIILTDTQSPQASFDSLSSLAELSGLPRHSVVAPSVLRISPVAAAVSGEPVP